MTSLNQLRLSTFLRCTARHPKLGKTQVRGIAHLHRSTVSSLLQPSSTSSTCSRPGSSSRHNHHHQTRICNSYTTSRRPYSSIPNVRGSGIQVSHVVGVLLVFGLAVTTWGLYDIYSSMTLWPKEVRDDLRMGLRAKYRGDLKLSQRYLARAWTTLLTLPSSLLSPDSFLKSSGLLITLAEVFEQDNQPLKAYWMYVLALKSGDPGAPTVRLFPEELLLEANKCLMPAQEREREVVDGKQKKGDGVGEVPLPPAEPLTLEGHLRMVALSLKLADMAEPLQRPSSEEAFWLAESLIYAELARKIVDGPDGEPKKMVKGDSSESELSLPRWATFMTSKSGKVSRDVLAAPYERTGAYYVKQGGVKESLTLYHRAIEILDGATDEDEFTKGVNMCRKAQLLNNCADALVRIYQTNPTEVSPSKTPSKEGAANSSVDGIPNFADPSVLLSSAMDHAIQAHFLSSKFVSEIDGRLDKVDVDRHGLCMQVLPVSVYNVGFIKELEGNIDEAKFHYKAALDFSRAFSFQDGVKEAKAALRRLDKKAKAKERDGGSVSKGSNTETSEIDIL